MGAFALVGYGQNISEKFIIFFPIIIFGCLSCYLLLNELLKNRAGSILGAFVYGFSTYFLAIDTQGHILITAAAAFGVMAVWQYTKFIRMRNSAHLILSGVLYSLSGFYDIRIPYLFAYVIVLLSIYFKSDGVELRRLASSLLKLLALVVVINLFWLLLVPLLGVDPQQNVLGRPLFGNQYWNIVSALSLQHPFWTGSALSWFTPAKPIIPLFIIPIISFYCLAVFRKSRLVLLFAVLACTGIFLGKQVDKPLGLIYPLLYSHVPGFDAFRESTKFYIFIALGYAGLTASAFAYSTQKMKGLILLGVVVVIGFNVFPIVSGEVRSLYIPRQLPHDYRVAENLIAGGASSTFYRTYWVPVYPKWFLGGINHPEINGIRLLSNMSNLNTTNSKDLSQAETLTSFLSSSYAHEMLSSFSVKYLFVPIRDEKNDDDVFSAYGDDRGYYIDSLNKLGWLKRIKTGATQLVAYENKDFSRYITTSSSLVGLSQVSNLDKLYSFAERQFNKARLPFTETSAGIPATKTLDLFTGLGMQNFKEDAASGVKINDAIQSQTKTTLYFNSNLVTLRYTAANSILTFYQGSLSKLYTSHKSLIPDQAEHAIDTLPLVSKKLYYISSDNTLSTLHGAANLGRVFESPQVFSASGSNLVENPSLETGLWQHSVGDCNNYDNRPQVGMSLSRQSIDGRYSLELDANRHTACTSPPAMSVLPNSPYVLSFHYKVRGANEAGYILSFNDPSKTTIKSKLLAGDDQWRTFMRKIDVPIGATKLEIQVLGVPDDQHRQISMTNYDNFNLQALTPELSLNINPAPNYQQVKLASSEQVSYKDPSYSYKNLITNPSLEQGLWQTKVRDCNNHDSHPEIAMSLSNLSSDGKHSLALESVNHTACTGPNPVTVIENSSYHFDFDYMSKNATQAAYYIEFNDPSRTVYTEQLNVQGKDWQEFSKTIKSPPRATLMFLTLYSYPKDVEKKNITTYYDNFHFIHIPDIENAFYATQQPTTKIKQPAKTDYHAVGPTKKLVHVRGATTPFYLNMSEAYHPKWRLEINNSKISGLGSWVPWAHADAVPASDHYKLDDFANGWYVDVNKLCKQESLCQKNADGSYNLSMEVEFTPQRWFYVGGIISGLTLLACFGCLTGYGVRRWRKKEV